ncbi:MAG: tyrosine-type recombinase/integrase [Methanobacteriaceae archaeon]
MAKRILKVREGEISQGKMPGICFERVKFCELLDDYMADFKINGKKTLSRAEGCVKQLQRHFGSSSAIDVNTPAIRKYIEMRQSDGVTNATINRELSAIKRAFNIGYRCTPAKVAQVPYIPMLKEHNIRKGFIEYGDYVALKNALPEYLKSVLTFAYFSGWRRSEILGLKWNQVNIKDGIVRLEPGETKNDEGRTLYMEPALRELMENIYRSRQMNCNYVFHMGGQRLGDFRKSWDTACMKIGKPGLLFHDLRRSAIRNVVRAGIPERVAMTISGHKTRNVFDRYNITSQDDLKDAARKRQKFNDKQAGQLHYSYILPKKVAKGLTLKIVTA